jgi:aspartate carbamoyltransferase catalytic subunit
MPDAHLIDIEDLSLAEIGGILDLADEIIRDRKRFAEVSMAESWRRSFSSRPPVRG